MGLTSADVRHTCDGMHSRDRKGPADHGFGRPRVEAFDRRFSYDGRPGRVGDRSGIFRRSSARMVESGNADGRRGVCSLSFQTALIPDAFPE